MKTYDVEQVDPELSEDGLAVAFYAWTSDPDVSFCWSVSLPMRVSEDAFEDLLVEWRQLGWAMLMRQQ